MVGQMGDHHVALQRRTLGSLQDSRGGCWRCCWCHYPRLSSNSQHWALREWLQNWTQEISLAQTKRCTCFPNTITLGRKRRPCYSCVTLCGRMTGCDAVPACLYPVEAYSRRTRCLWARVREGLLMCGIGFFSLCCSVTWGRSFQCRVWCPEGRTSALLCHLQIWGVWMICNQWWDSVGKGMWFIRVCLFFL